MHMLGVRLSEEITEALRLESQCLGRPVSETLRSVINRHVAKEVNHGPLLEKLEQLHISLRELGRDIETVTRLFLVASKTASEEDAKEWCKLNLMVGR